MGRCSDATNIPWCLISSIFLIDLKKEVIREKEKICKCGMIGRIVPFIKVIDQDRRHQARIKLHDSKGRYEVCQDVHRLMMNLNGNERCFRSLVGISSCKILLRFISCTVSALTMPTFLIRRSSSHKMVTILFLYMRCSEGFDRMALSLFICLL